MFLFFSHWSNLTTAMVHKNNSGNMIKRVVTRSPRGMGSSVKTLYTVPNEKMVIQTIGRKQLRIEGLKIFIEYPAINTKEYYKQETCDPDIEIEFPPAHFHPAGNLHNDIGGVGFS